MSNNKNQIITTDASSPQIPAEKGPSRRKFLGQVSAALAGGAILGKAATASAQNYNPAIGDGLTNKMIARRLDISPHTVKFHVESLLRKLGARTRAEAVAKAREHRLSNTVEL